MRGLSVLVCVVLSFLSRDFALKDLRQNGSKAAKSKRKKKYDGGFGAGTRTEQKRYTAVCGDSSANAPATSEHCDGKRQRELQREKCKERQMEGRTLCVAAPAQARQRPPQKRTVLIAGSVIVGTSGSVASGKRSSAVSRTPLCTSSLRKKNVEHTRSHTSLWKDKNRHAHSTFGTESTHARAGHARESVGRCSSLSLHSFSLARAAPPSVLG